MNLQPLFETQKILDDRIVKEKGLEGQDLLSEKILALQVELGECANEWRGFKFWSKDREPRIEAEVPCTSCDGTGDLNHEAVQEDAEGCGGHEYIDCEECDCSGTARVKNPLLEEYVDCLHFILSIGNYLGVVWEEMNWLMIEEENITKRFQHVFCKANELAEYNSFLDERWGELFEEFYHLGKMLGLTWEQIEEAYYAKNEINHTRQATGY